VKWVMNRLITYISQECNARSSVTFSSGLALNAASCITKVEEIQQDATVCRYLFTAKLLYMFRASIAPIIRST
jgi:hypothetical protein